MSARALKWRNRLMGILAPRCRMLLTRFVAGVLALATSAAVTAMPVPLRESTISSRGHQKTFASPKWVRMVRWFAPMHMNDYAIGITRPAPNPFSKRLNLKSSKLNLRLPIEYGGGILNINDVD